MQKKQHQGMCQGEKDRDVGGPLVQPEYVEMAVRPVAHGAVPQRNEQPEEQVDCGRTCGAQAEVGAEIQ